MSGLRPPKPKTGVKIGEVEILFGWLIASLTVGFFALIHSPGNLYYFVLGVTLISPALFISCLLILVGICAESRGDC